MVKVIRKVNPHRIKVYEKDRKSDGWKEDYSLINWAMESNKA